MRAAIYARYSIDLQSQNSIEDQVALCRIYAERMGFMVAEVYSDAALSGASTVLRYDWQRLMADAKAHRFDVVIAEDVDRITRDQADWHGAKKRLRFYDVEIHTAHSGVVGELDGSLRAMVGEEQLRNIAHKVRRGLAGVVRSGRHAGGRAYGFRPVAGKPGQFRIVKAEAEVVRRIFKATKAGKTPREIAGELNRDKVPAPRGPHWNASTINGSRQRRNGILHNELYIGRLVWNRLRMVKDPDTGKRVSRLNPESEWQRAQARIPAIVPLDLFEAVQKPAREMHARLSNEQKPKHLLSGLLCCGACGGGMSVHGTDKSGKVRIRCSRTRESGTCDHRRRYYLNDIENLVLAGLKTELAEPVLIKHYLDTYVAEQKGLARTIKTKRAKLETRLGELNRTLRRIVDTIADGSATGREVGGRLKELEAQREAVEAELAMPEAVRPVALHPATVKSYLSKIEKLSKASTRAESGEGIRDLVESVTVIPVAAGEPVEVKLRGYLATLTAAPMAPAGRYRAAAGGGLLGGFAVVAEEGFEPPTHGL